MSSWLATGLKDSRLRPKEPPLQWLGAVHRLAVVAPHLGKPLAALCEQHAPAAAVLEAARHALFSQWCQQSAWTEELHGAQSTAFDQAVTARLGALRKSQESPGAGLWLTAIPGKTLGHGGPECAFSAEEWQLLLRARVGAPCFPSGSCCAGCGALMDVFGDHALCCPSTGMYRHHNRIRDTLFHLAQAANWNPLLEAPLGSSLERPADVLLRASADTRPVAVDVTVQHPLRLSASAAVRADVSISTEQAERTKEKARLAVCSQAGWLFRPFALDTTGGFGPKAVQMCKALARQLSMRRGCDADLAFGGVQLSFAVALAKGRGEMLANAVPLV